jgi:hypothetical protein
MRKTLLLTVLLCVFQTRAQYYVFYLHGRIVETKGPNAVDSINGFGKYHYYPILDSLRNHGKFTVISEVRGKNTDVKMYAKKVCRQIDSLIFLKVDPSKITVIGASKGSRIAMYVSTYLSNKSVNYVFMAACDEGLPDSDPELSVTGNVLSIYEKSDFAGSCRKLKDRSPKLVHYKEIEINTGLRHGFLYRPLSEWVQPARKWATGDYR